MTRDLVQTLDENRKLKEIIACSEGVAAKEKEAHHYTVTIHFLDETNRYRISDVSLY